MNVPLNYMAFPSSMAFADPEKTEKICKLKFDLIEQRRQEFIKSIRKARNKLIKCLDKGESVSKLSNDIDIFQYSRNLSAKTTNLKCRPLMHL